MVHAGAPRSVEPFRSLVVPVVVEEAEWFPNSYRYGPNALVQLQRRAHRASLGLPPF